MPTRDYSKFSPEGFDYEWYASDAAGHIAVFTTGGKGPVPSAILSALQHNDALGDAVKRLPMRGGATMLVSLPRPDFFRDIARRGLFAYDWRDVHRAAVAHTHCYEMLSRPEMPLHLSELPEQFYPLLRSTALLEVRFAESSAIDVRRWFECG